VITAIRDNPARARALGYPVQRYKLLAFVLSATIAGLAGGLHAVGHGFASLTDVHWTTSGKVVLMVVLGGIGTLWGASIGAALVVQLEDYLSGAGFIGVDMVIGAVFVLVVLLFRRGIWGTAEQVWAAVSRRRSSARPGGTSPGEVGPAEQRDTVDAGRVDAGREVT
jgi:branched-chain amino acid transport system permease protein